MLISDAQAGPSGSQPVEGDSKQELDGCGQQGGSADAPTIPIIPTSPLSPSTYSSCGGSRSPESTNGGQSLANFQISGLTTMSTSDREDDSELKSLTSSLVEQTEISENVANCSTGDKRPTPTPTPTPTAVEVRFLVRRREAGAIIGRRGLNIKRLREVFSSSAFDVPDTGNGPERIVRITTDRSNLRPILEEITSLLHEKSHQSDDQMEVKILVHSSQAGSMIGKGGQAINKLRNESGAAIKIYELCCPYSSDRVCAVKAKQSVVVSTIVTILEILKESPVRGTAKPYDALYFDPIIAPRYGGYTADDELYMLGQRARSHYEQHKIETREFIRKNRLVYQEPSSFHYDAHQNCITQDPGTLLQSEPHHMKNPLQQSGAYHFQGPYSPNPMVNPIPPTADHMQPRYFGRRRAGLSGQCEETTENAVMAAKMAAAATAANIMAAAFRGRYHPYADISHPIGPSASPGGGHFGPTRQRHNQPFSQPMNPMEPHQPEPRVPQSGGFIRTSGRMTKIAPFMISPDRGMTVSQQQDPTRRLRINNRAPEACDQPPSQWTEASDQAMNDKG